MKKSYHFFTASTAYYESNSFDELLKEEEKYKCIYWNIGKHHVNKGDICYFYYSNLPDESSRILFYGEVDDTDYLGLMIDKPKECKDNNYIKIRLKCLPLEDKKSFSLNNLRYKYKLVPEKGQFSYLHVYENNDNHKRLIDDINLLMVNNKKTINSANNYFKNNYCHCFFGHNTFIEENGFWFINIHHLVQRSLLNKNLKTKGLDLLIEDGRNKYGLCPMCHAKIHHAKKEEKRKLIKVLYEKNKSFFDDNFNELKNGKTTLEWLYGLYKCNNIHI